MIKRYVLAGLLASSLLSCQQKTENATAQEATSQKDLNGLLKEYWDQNARFFPMEATAQGDNRYNHLLPNSNTKAFRDSLSQFYQGYLTKLHTYTREELKPNDQISYDVLNYDLTNKLEGLKLNTWMMPFHQMGGLPLTMGQYGSGEGNQPFKTVKDYENWLGRVKGFTVWADSAIANFRQGMAAGVVMPKPLVQKMIPQMQDLVVTDPTKSLFYGPIKRFPKEISAEDQQRLTAAYKQAILTEVVPTYKKMADFLKNEYLPKARTSTGYAALPNGDALYKYYVKLETTTNKTPDEIYQTGLNEVKRIRLEMEKLKDQVGFKGDLKAFFAYLNSDPKFKPYKTPEDVLNAFRSVQTRIEPNLDKMFGRKPKTKFEVRQTEAFRAASASIEYNPGSPDGSRPGVFYVPVVNAKEYNSTSGIESTFLHEAIPGHHYQISLQQENKDLPDYRRFSFHGAYVEGWALYAESMGKELGVYTDPYMYMGALSDEIHRAIRLVVDVGMHYKGMTREQAIQYSLENEASSEAAVIAEIERYMAMPGQALSYKVGALKIQELRDKYKQQLGSKFSLSNFHDEILRDGSLPLEVLEKKMDAWAAAQK